MGTTAIIYRIIVLGHLAAVIVGFGGLIAHGALHAKAVQSDAVAAAPLLRSAIDISRIAEYGIYATLALGIILVSLSDDVYGYGEVWISASFLVWFGVVGATRGLVRPGRRRLFELADSITQSAAALGPMARLQDHELAKPLVLKLAVGEALTQLLMVAGLVLMVWKPGH
ncbi:MAG: hypothetical protein OER95_05270 [Acidimicrobiia bacterium]|nr:hypothetical protein [Acidimicrobiia bacterium]